VTGADSLPRHRLGARGPEVTRLGLGCAPIGNLYSAVSDDDAAATVDAAWDAGIRFFDTAPLYGHGLSEQRLGRALANRPRDSYVLATKVGRLLVPATDLAVDTIFADIPPLEPVFDFSRDAVLRSIEASLGRLGIDRLDVVHVHDPDHHEHEAIEGAFPTLIELRDEGVIGAVGCGMNQVAMLERFVQRVDLDCILLAGRYTLLDRSGHQLLDLCLDRGVGVILGGVFNSGILASPSAEATFDYGRADDATVRRAMDMQAACSRHSVRLPAAAIQFALEHPAVASAIVGARSAAEISTDVVDASVPINEQLWSELTAI
jgi:D-threo-aldose 1-dehydrogenase